MAAGLGNDAAQMALSGVGTSNGKLEEPDHSSSNWYFSREEIEKRSPSRLDGIDLKKETYFRKSYCTFLQDLGMCLKVPQVTIATAIVFSHRFFLRQSHSKNDRFMIATICMFLAGKVEETPRPLRDVIITSFEIRHKKDPAAIPRIKQKEIYDEHKELVLMGERLVLTTLGFDLNIHHPYKPLVAAIKKLKVAQNALAQVAWNFVNDGLRTSLCLQFKPHHIAAGAIFLAAKFLKVKLPSDGEKVWWQEFEVTPRQLEEVSNQMLELYEQNKTSGPGAANGARPSDAGTSALATNRTKGLDGAALANGHHWTHLVNAAGADKVDKHAQTVKAEDSVASGRREDNFQGSDKSRTISHTEGEYEPGLENGVPDVAGVDGSNKPPRAVANGQGRHGVQDDVKEPVSEAKSSMEERETGDVVDSKPGTESNGQSGKVKADAEDEEPKKVLSTNIQDVNTDRVKALKQQKSRRSKGEGLDSKSTTAKVEPTDEEELLERELESGVEAAAEAEKVKQERRGTKVPGQKPEYDGMHGKNGAEDGDFVSKRRRFNDEENFNDKKRTKSSERGDRTDWGDVEPERGRPGASADRVEEGELPSFNGYPYEQARSPRLSDRRPMMAGSHENGSPSSKRYRDVHGRRDGHRDNRGQHGGGNSGGGGGGGRDRDYHSRDHHHQHRQEGDRERYYHKDRDYQDRDHKKVRGHEVHGN